MGRWLLRGFAVLILLIGIAAAGGYYYLRTSLPQLDGEIALAGPSAPITITRDRNGIPHIEGQSIEDALFGLGFVHAQDRLWQMEMNRRIGAGRLSEILGEATVGTDRFLRTLGVYHFAERNYSRLKPETRARLDAYAAGVNAFLENRSGALPVEFVILGVDPEPWTAADSLVWLKMMAWDLSANWSSELLRFALTERLTPTAIGQFLPPYPGDAPVSLPNLKALYDSTGRGLTRLAGIAPPHLPRGAGSNNWAVSGARTVTGKPLLANDPHLGLSAPALWYLAHLKAPGLDTIGATLPGIPAVVLGRNDRIAWGFTNTGPDVQDLYIERNPAGDPDSYLTPDGPAAFAFRDEVIKVKDSAPVSFRVRISRHGPIISDAMASVRADLPSDTGLAFAWTALDDDDTTADGGLAMMTATDWDSFVGALRSFRVPQQNILYADVDGNIGYYAPAHIPMRKAENDIRGLMPSPGWDDRYDWDGYIPFEDLPQAFNPESGVIYTANQKVVPDNYPYHLTFEWTPPYRARRIATLLDETEKHSVESFRAMQADVRSTMAGDLLPLMTTIEGSDEKAALALAQLRAWDGTMAADMVEPLIFSAWYREFTRLVYSDDLGPDLFADAWSQRPVFITNVLLDREGQGAWCDDVTTDAVEDCPTMLRRALDLAIADLETRYGSDRTAWNWGTAHHAHGEHRPFGKVPVLKDLFDVDVPTMGGTYTVDAGRFDIANGTAPFANVHSASYRAIYDLADLDRSIFIHSTGQSGNRLSPLYKNWAEDWAKVGYVAMTTSAADYQAGALGRLILTPKPD
ncbi:penicillin acylase family protein [Oceanibacterium hippocampi]|uniref:Acyl-homoserine lactone acylase QuiP n=1 Tax=Oceanibacterium hippocampi TaxID=745714 RepID=A0A1Y5SQW8_9PROT|nr:penicillin acylase family protein [Oceanibacterium hippocampi]SLN44538.1 Acyl-homoserine lactone acylase QuiP precursor [Oceanibacterium hippocampi]